MNEIYNLQSEISEKKKLISSLTNQLIQEEYFLKRLEASLIKKTPTIKMKAMKCP